MLPQSRQMTDGSGGSQTFLNGAGYGERFGAVHIVDLLMARANDKAVALKHTELPVFGLGRDRPRTNGRALCGSSWGPDS